MGELIIVSNIQVLALLMCDGARLPRVLMICSGVDADFRKNGPTAVLKYPCIKGVPTRWVRFAIALIATPVL